MGTLRKISLLVRGEAIVLNKILVSAGATLSAVGLIAAAPADASTLSFDFQLEASADVELSPLFAGRTLAGITLPDSINVTADEVTGSFVALDDLAQVTDGDIELNYDFISGALDDSYVAVLESILADFGLTVDQTLQSFDDLFNVTQFNGSGILTSESFDVAGDPNNPSPFDINYDNQTNTVVIDGYSNKVATSCFWADCGITATVSYGVSLVIGEFVTFTGDLLANPNISLSDEAVDAISGLQRVASLIQMVAPSLDAINVATVTATISADTEFVAENPNGSADDVSVDVTGGALTVTATTDGQSEELLSMQYPEGAESTAAEKLSEPTGTLLTAVETQLPGASLTTTSKASIMPQLSMDAEADVIKPAVVEAPSSGGAVVLTAPSPIIASVSKTDDNEAQDVPEPSIVLGFLGTAAWMAKRSRSRRAASQ